MLKEKMKLVAASEGVNIYCPKDGCPIVAPVTVRIVFVLVHQRPYIDAGEGVISGDKIPHPQPLILGQKNTSLVEGVFKPPRLHYHLKPDA